MILIFKFAEICSVASAYDRMVLNPYEKEQLAPQEVIGKLITMTGTVYNKDIIITLVKVVPLYPVGIYVKVVGIDDSSLTGYYGVVAQINEDNLGKPVIIFVVDNRLKKIKPKKIDTSQFNNVRLEIIL